MPRTRPRVFQKIAKNTAIDIIGVFAAGRKNPLSGTFNTMMSQDDLESWCLSRADLVTRDVSQTFDVPGLPSIWLLNWDTLSFGNELIGVRSLVRTSLRAAQLWLWQSLRGSVSATDEVRLIVAIALLKRSIQVESENSMYDNVTASCMTILSIVKTSESVPMLARISQFFLIGSFPVTIRQSAIRSIGLCASCRLCQLGARQVIDSLPSYQLDDFKNNVPDIDRAHGAIFALSSCAYLAPLYQSILSNTVNSDSDFMFALKLLLSVKHQEPGAWH